jgi:hypothetical protein
MGRDIDSFFEDE